MFDEVRKHHPDCIYLTSTRHPVDAELLCEFKEEHSHATDHLIYYPVSAAMRQTVAEAQTLVLVDDEATTGKRSSIFSPHYVHRVHSGRYDGLLLSR